MNAVTDSFLLTIFCFPSQGEKQNCELKHLEFHRSNFCFIAKYKWKPDEIDTKSVVFYALFNELFIVSRVLSLMPKLFSSSLQMTLFVQFMYKIELQSMKLNRNCQIVNRLTYILL